MDFLKKFFPFSFKFETTKQFVWTIILYCVGAFVAGIIFGLMSNIPFVGWMFSIASYLTSLYATAGVVFSILYKVGVFK
ncbi:MAG: hypothetical protein IJZ54_04970 [Clostridia bacterium]|nr:hypothetical protein [Clostridia bacterium]